MMNLITRHFEKLGLILVVLALLVSSGWTGRRYAEVGRLKNELIQGAPVGAKYHSADWQPAPTKTTSWVKPPAQSDGPGWLYEVFTPPVIYYNATARSFAVIPPQYQGETDGLVFGLELLAVKLEPYRLQLVGYFGSPGDYLAAFVSSKVPETLLARAGRRFDQLGLTLKSFDVRKVTLPGDVAQPVYDIAALAVLQDENTGAEVVLDSRVRKLTDKPVAVFKLPGKNGSLGELHEGDSFADADTVYRIERIQLDPPEVVVARIVPGLSVPETRMLRPAGRLAAKDKKSGLHIESSTIGVATTGQ